MITVSVRMYFDYDFIKELEQLEFLLPNYNKFWLNSQLSNAGTNDWKLDGWFYIHPIHRTHTAKPTNQCITNPLAVNVGKIVTHAHTSNRLANVKFTNFYCQLAEFPIPTQFPWPSNAKQIKLRILDPLCILSSSPGIISSISGDTSASNSGQIASTAIEVAISVR